LESVADLRIEWACLESKHRVSFKHAKHETER
jgi:hypothetical protein